MMQTSTVVEIGCRAKTRENEKERTEDEEEAQKRKIKGNLKSNTNKMSETKFTLSIRILWLNLMVLIFSGIFKVQCYIYVILLGQLFWAILLIFLIFLRLPFYFSLSLYRESVCVWLV